MVDSKKKTFVKLLIANFITLLAVFTVIEGAGQIYAYFHRSYKILPFIPDPVFGWRFIPNSEHIMTGRHWYAREFNAKVKINSHGFRDFERSIKKEKNKLPINFGRWSEKRTVSSVIWKKILQRFRKLNLF